MERSSDRILTTHVGSLPRPPDLLADIDAEEQGRGVDAKSHAARLRADVREVVRKQVELGIDVIDDGEFGKPSFVSYVNERLGGFEIDREVPRPEPVGKLARGEIVSRILCRRPRGGAPAAHGMHRCDQLSRPGPIADRYR